MSKYKRRMPRKRNRRSDAAEAMAAAYRCGHCRSENRGVTVDWYGISRVLIAHDDGCPVLSGAVDDAPDILRAAIRAGVGALAVVEVRSPEGAA